MDKRAWKIECSAKNNPTVNRVLFAMGGESIDDIGRAIADLRDNMSLELSSKCNITIKPCHETITHYPTGVRIYDTNVHNVTVKQPTVNRKPVITLCGSHLNRDLMNEIEERFVYAGNVVLPIAHVCPLNYDTMDVAEALEIHRKITILLEAHKQKILMSDKLYVVNKDGNISVNMMEEIKFAEANNIEVEYMEPVNK